MNYLGPVCGSNVPNYRSSSAPRIKTHPAGQQAEPPLLAQIIFGILSGPIGCGGTGAGNVSENINIDAGHDDADVADVMPSDVAQEDAAEEDATNPANCNKALDKTPVSESQSAQFSPSFAYLGNKEYAFAWSDDRQNPGNNQVVFLSLKDENLKPIGAETPVTDPSLSKFAPFPSLAWNGNAGDFGLAWIDTSGVHFETLTEAGVKTGGPADLILSSGFLVHIAASAVWTGKEYGVGYSENETGTMQVYFQKLSEKGDLIGPALKVSNGFNDSTLAQNYSLVWTGSEFGIAWFEGNTGIKFRRITEPGALAGSEVDVSSDVASADYKTYNNGLSLSWNGQGYAIIWAVPGSTAGTTNLYFREISQDGTSMTPAVKVTGESDLYLRAPSMAWRKGEYGLIWLGSQKTNNLTREMINFQRLSDNGTVIGQPILIDKDETDTLDFGQLQLAAHENGYAAVWDRRKTDPNPFAVLYSARSFFTRLDCSSF